MKWRQREGAIGARFALTRLWRLLRQEIVSIGTAALGGMDDVLLINLREQIDAG
jgi:hypothetical protein